MPSLRRQYQRLHHTGDVKSLVLAHGRFKVVDARSGDDLTQRILTQLVLDEEGAGVPLLSTELLAQMIRGNGRATQGVLGRDLEANVKAFAEVQKKSPVLSLAVFVTKFAGTPNTSEK